MGNVSPLTHVMGYLLIAIIIALAIAAVATIAYGMRLRAKRRAADAEVLERGEDAGIETRPASNTIAEPGALPEKTETAPQAQPEPAEARPRDPAPVAPAPVAPAPVPAVATAVPAATGDLTQLKGLGPKVAARLGELGVTRIDQLAALSPADADALDAQLGSFSGRMARDRWVEQAKLLAAGDKAGFEAAFGKL